MFCKVPDPSLISIYDQLRPFVRKANISFDFHMNFIYRLPKADFRKVSERMRASTLHHSTRLLSTLLHSTNVSS